MSKQAEPQTAPAIMLPSVERIQQELASAQSVDDFFGRDGILARLFAHTLEQMLEAELTEHLGYERHAASGRNSGNSRNGKRERNLRTSGGDVSIQVPRDRNSEFALTLLEKYQTSTNELEEKIIDLYAKGVSTRDIQETLADLYGVEVSAATISAITDEIWGLVEAWQTSPLASVYPIIYLDAIRYKLRRDGRVQNTAVYIVLGVDVDGQRDVLGHWVGAGAEGANFWLTVVSDLRARGVEEIFIACIDGLAGFKEAIQVVCPQTVIERCIIHQIRASLNYVSWKDRKAFVADLKQIYQAPTGQEAELHILELGERWGKQYATVVRSWERNWEDLATMFAYPAEIRRLIYTTNTVEGYSRQLRKVTKTKRALPSAEAVREKEAYVYDHFASSVIPIPRVVHLGRLMDVHFAISEKAPGQNLLQIPRSEYLALIPRQIELLDAIHQIPVGDKPGYGIFDGRGVAFWPSWRSHLAFVREEEPAGDFYEGWHALFESSFLERDLFEHLYSQMMQLIGNCPEERYLVHGGYGFGNVLAQDGRITAILDWMDARYGDFLFDAAWLDFWSPEDEWHARFQQHYERMSREVTSYSERILCYQCYIALEALKFNAKAADRASYDYTRQRILSLLHGRLL